jgi:NADH-quinone oxidoreductase subunit A
VTTEQYLPIVLMAVLAFIFAAASFMGSIVLGPKRSTPTKDGPYECGIVPSRTPPARFPVRFYLISMIFIIFDIEIVFLYPWAVMYHQLDTFGLAEMVTFVAAVFVAFIYLLSNGALDWGPSKRFSRTSDGPARTSSSTVRRVPRPNLDGSSTPVPRVAAEVPTAEPEPVGTLSGTSADPK